MNPLANADRSVLDFTPLRAPLADSKNGNPMLKRPQVGVAKN